MRRPALQDEERDLLDRALRAVGVNRRHRSEVAGVGGSGRDGDLEPHPEGRCSRVRLIAAKERLEKMRYALSLAPILMHE